MPTDLFLLNGVYQNINIKIRGGTCFSILSSSALFSYQLYNSSKIWLQIYPSPEQPLVRVFRVLRDSGFKLSSLLNPDRPPVPYDGGILNYLGRFLGLNSCHFLCLEDPLHDFSLDGFDCKWGLLNITNFPSLGPNFLAHKNSPHSQARPETSPTLMSPSHGHPKIENGQFSVFQILWSQATRQIISVLQLWIWGLLEGYLEKSPMNCRICPWIAPNH